MQPSRVYYSTIQYRTPLYSLVEPTAANHSPLQHSTAQQGKVHLNIAKNSQIQPVTAQEIEVTETPKDWPSVYKKCRIFAVWLWRLQSDCGDYSLIVDIAVWLTRLTSDCVDYSLIVEIAVWNEWNKRDFWTEGQCLEFFYPVLSTNQRLRFWALYQWEASISGPPILTHFQN